MKYIALLLLFATACKTDLPSSFKKADSELLETWKVFKKSIKTNDKELLKSISADSIWCSACKDNSPKEQEFLDSLRENFPNQYFDNLAELNTIEFDRFYSEDFPLFFDQNLLNRLADTSKVSFHPPHKYQSYYEFSVLTMDPNSLHEGFEGYQRVLQFCKTKEGYKFCGVSSVP